MPAFPTPSLPTTGSDPTEQRSRNGLSEFVRSLLRSNAFLARLVLSQQLRAPMSDGSIPAIRWGDLNRVSLTASASVQLPRISAAWIGVPLQVCKVTSIGTLTIVPSGKALDGVTALTIDGAASKTVSAAGLFSFVTDGQSWFASVASATGGLGDVVGPATAVDGNLAAYDGTTGKLIKDSLTSKAALEALINARLALSGWFGSGSDGDLTSSAGTTTLTKPTHYNDVTLTGTAKIHTAGWPLWVNGVLNLDAAAAGAINFDGNDAVLNTGGLQLFGAWFGGDAAVTQQGGNAGSSGTGVGGLGGAGTHLTPSNGGENGQGGTGGTGNGGANAGGSGGGNPSAPTRFSQQAWFTSLFGWLSGVATPIKGGGSGSGGGGGGGGGGSGNRGHSGGGGGGTVVVYARTISRTASTAVGAIRSRGGAAAVGSAGIGTDRGGGGGGGSGGGGGAYVFCGGVTGASATNAITSPGGAPTAGGNGSGTGLGGNGGGAGGGGEVLFIDYGAGITTYLAPSARIAGGAASGITGGAAAVPATQGVSI